MADQITPGCSSIKVTLDVMGGKWKPLIMYLLVDKTLRFSELQRSISKITQKMLTEQLRELEKDGLILRKVYPQVPPKVEYSMTPYGKTLLPVLETMHNWGQSHREVEHVKNQSLEKNKEDLSPRATITL
jgi:DNA-binding HxlR family transcriptional regulator